MITAYFVVEGTIDTVLLCYEDKTSIGYQDKKLVEYIPVPKIEARW